MKFLAGFIGAVVGAVFASITMYWTVADGNDVLGSGMVEFSLPVLVVGAVCGIVLGLSVLRYLRQEGLTPTKRRKRNVIISSFFVGVFALASWMVAAADAKIGPPSDQVLLDDFPHHEALLNQIVQMVQQDKPYLTSTPMHVPSGRMARYRQLSDEANVKGSFFNMDAAGEVDFEYYLNGSVLSSETNAGYAYLTKPPAHLVNNLDGYQFNEQDDDQKAYRHIYGNWYLYREYEPG